MTLVLAAVGAAIAFAPSWDSFTLKTASGVSQTITEGNAFANPGWVITGDVLVMVAFVLVVILAALRRPMRLGAALAIGAIIPMVASGHLGHRPDQRRSGDLTAAVRHHAEPGRPAGTHYHRRPDADVLGLLRLRRDADPALRLAVACP